MAGFPKEMAAHGGYKRWMKYKTEAQFRARLRQNPNDLAVLHRYALFLYNRKRNIALAENLFQRVLSLNGEYVEALVDYANLCWNRYRMADKDRKDENDKHKAERMLRQAVDIVQGAGLHHSRAYSKLALLLDAEHEDKSDEALSFFRLAAASDPRDAVHAYNLAHHLDERHELEEAAVWYKKAIKINMDHAPALSNYANLLW